MILELQRCLFRDFKRINNFQKVDIFGDGKKPGRGGILTSKPIKPTPGTLKADLTDSNMLITKIIGKNVQWMCVSSPPTIKGSGKEERGTTGNNIKEDGTIFCLLELEQRLQLQSD